MFYTGKVRTQIKFWGQNSVFLKFDIFCNGRKSWRRTVVVLFGNYGNICLTFLEREIPDFIFFVLG